MDLTKPHKGSLKNWRKYPLWSEANAGDRYMLTGEFVGHPEFDGMKGHTSEVLKMEGNEIETRNSRYTLIGDELDQPAE